MGGKGLALMMEEVESVVEGLGVDVRDFDDAAHGHLVDQQFENGLVLVMFPLPSGGLDVLGKRLAADATAPAGIANRRLAKGRIRPGGTDRHLISMVGTVSIHGVTRPSDFQAGVTAECGRDDRWGV